MRQFEADHLSRRSDGSLAAAFVFGVDFLVDSRRLKVALVGLAQEQHFVLLLAQLLVRRLILPELTQNVLRSQRVFDRAIWRRQAELIQKSAQCFNGRHWG